MTVQDLNQNATTSLDIRNETVDRRCPKRPYDFVVCVQDPSIIVFTGCKAYICDVCGPKKVRKVTRAISWASTVAERSRFVTMTQAPEDWQKRRQKMRDMARWAKANDYQWNVAWTTEVGSDTGMIHVHAIHHGSFIPQDVLQDRWGAIVDIRAIKKDNSKVANYIGKGSGKVANYIAKSGNTHYRDWLNLNGQRPIHWSREFFFGLGVEEVIKISRPIPKPGEELTWRLPFPTEIEREIHAKGLINDTVFP